MSEQPQRTGTIDVEPLRNIMRDRYRFVARDASGEVVLEGAPFTSAMFRMSERKQERVMLRSLITELAVLGWQAVPTGEAWYTHRIYFRGSGTVPVTVETTRREGLSPTAMWAWTIAIMLVLFVVCVVLVLSAELQIRPA